MTVTFDERVGAARDGVAVDEQHGDQLDVAVLVCLDAVEGHDRADLDLLLPPSGAHNCVNHVFSQSVGFRLGDPARAARNRSFTDAGAIDS